MSLIIILPLISADTWFNSDPTIDQMMDSYFNIAANLTEDNRYYFLRQMIASSLPMTSPIMYMSVQIGNHRYVYPDDFMDLAQPEAPLSDYM
jgi:hypothetical protein